LPVSWKPLVKSNDSAVITTRTRIKSFTQSASAGDSRRKK
jgi:hypothetical protein